MALLSSLFMGAKRVTFPWAVGGTGTNKYPGPSFLKSMIRCLSYAVQPKTRTSDTPLLSYGSPALPLRRPCSLLSPIGEKLPGTPNSSDLRGPVSRWHTFIDLCVSHHLPIGGRITG